MSVDSHTLNFSDNETPGYVGGSQLCLQHVPTPGESLLFFRNGLLQTVGVDYVATGFFIFLNTPRDDGDVFTAFYRF